MKRAFIFLVLSFVVGELDPIGWASWRVLERQLPRVKQVSLAAPSPFEEIPRSAWLAESEHAYVAESGFRVIINTNPHGAQTVYHLHMHVRGGQQLREPLLPLLWGRLTQRWQAG